MGGEGLATAGAATEPGQGRWMRLIPRLPAHDRREVIEALMLRPSRVLLRRFAVLLLLSAVVATVGLLQDSTAVVIGAMMIAPLMSPIMGTAASLVMGWGARLVQGAAIVAVSVAAVIALAWMIAALLPPSGAGLPTEVLARSSPDVRDLLVALAAGGAGAYATVRKDVSGALPGVAVAVALVPPLASAGVLLGRGQPDLARGAGLLFATNLFAIVLAAAVVFVLTGFVPAHRVATQRRRLAGTLALATVPVLVLGSLLTARFMGTADEAGRLRLATQTVEQWLGTGDQLDRVALAGSTVQVHVTGATAPPQIQSLTSALTSALGRTTTVDLGWTPVTDAATKPAAGPALDQLYPIVQQWLAAQSLTLGGLSYNPDGTLVVTATGAKPPNSSQELSALIDTRLGTQVQVSLAWTQQSSGASTVGPGSPQALAQSTADQWAASQPGTAVVSVGQNSGNITITLIGSRKPDTTTLQNDLAAALPHQGVTIQWLTGSVLAQITPTPTTPPTVTATIGPIQ